MFEIADDEVVRRLGGRTVCEGCQTPYTGRAPGDPCPKPGCGGKLVRRKDDEPEAIRTRMRTYREQTEPVVEWYRADATSFIEVDATGGVDEITERVMSALAECGAKGG
jgi:adenylate kinase